MKMLCATGPTLWAGRMPRPDRPRAVTRRWSEVAELAGSSREPGMDGPDRHARAGPAENAGVGSPASGHEKTLRAPGRAWLPLLRFRPGGVGLDAAARRAVNSLPVPGR